MTAGRGTGGKRRRRARGGGRPWSGARPSAARGWRWTRGFRGGCGHRLGRRAAVPRCRRFPRPPHPRVRRRSLCGAGARAHRVRGSSLPSAARPATRRRVRQASSSSQIQRRRFGWQSNQLTHPSRSRAAAAAARARMLARSARSWSRCAWRSLQLAAISLRVLGPSAAPPEGLHNHGGPEAMSVNPRRL